MHVIEWCNTDRKVVYGTEVEAKKKSETMKLICDLPSPKSLPDKYVLPPEKRPCDNELRDDLSVALPVIDLRGAMGDGRRQVIGEIMEAGKEFGFFQAR